MGIYSDALRQYLDGKPQAALASKIGKSQAAISRYVGGRLPDAETARNIDDKTEGRVPFALWQAEALQKLGIAA